MYPSGPEEVPAAPENQGSASSASNGGGGEPQSATVQKDVLVVDDSAELLEWMKLDLESRGYRVHTARTRRRAKPAPPAPTPATRHPARRWVIERTNSWHNRFRKLRVRYEKDPDNYLGLVHVACILIVYRLRRVLG